MNAHIERARNSVTFTGWLFFICAVLLIGGLVRERHVTHATDVKIANAYNRGVQGTWRSLVGGCKRANVLRIESNKRIDANEDMKAVIGAFLGSAEKARRAAYATTAQPLDLEAANEYARLSRKLQGVTYSQIAEVNCKTAYPRPALLRP
jgi:type II secretory pathway component PulL